MNLRRFAPRLIALALAVSVGSLPQPARAEGPSVAELQNARAKFQRGIELEQAGNWSEAIQQFRAVGVVRMTPQVRFHIAYCEEGLGRLVTALGGYELALAEADQVGPDFKHEAEGAVLRLRARIPKLVIERGTNAEAALVQIDGVELGASSIGGEIPLDPGPHTITASAPGYQQFSTGAELKEQAVTRVTIDLMPAPKDAGPNTIERRVIVESPPGPNRTVPYIVGGAGVGVLAVSGVLLALRLATQSELEKDCPDRNRCPESNYGTYRRLKTYNVVTPIVATVGIATIGVAVALILFEKKPAKPKEESGLAFTPAAKGALAGASLDYRF
jgi:hypothetical protein